MCAVSLSFPYLGRSQRPAPSRQSGEFYAPLLKPSTRRRHRIDPLLWFQWDAEPVPITRWQRRQPSGRLFGPNGANERVEIRLDDKLLERTNADGELLETLIADVNRSVAHDRRTVTAVICDGNEMDAVGLSAALKEPLGNFQRVDLRSQPASTVAAEVLAQAAALFEETEKDQPTIVELLGEGNTVRGMELLAGSFRLWQQAHEAVIHAVRLSGVNLDEVRIADTPAIEVIDGLRDKLAQIKEALEARDYVMLADILQYELSETIQNWKSLIARLRGMATGL